MGKKVGGALLGAVIATGLAIATGGASIAAGGAFFGLEAGTIGAFFARQFVTSAVLGFISSALAPKPTSAAQLQGLQMTGRSPIAARRVIYGTVRVGGNVVFMETTGDNNVYLHQVMTVAGHEVNSIKEVYYNDAKVYEGGLSDGVQVSPPSGLSSPDYNGHTVFTAHFGDPDQVADTNLVADTSWSTNHRLRNIAYLYTRMDYDADFDGYASGVPNVSVLVEGRRIFDPRDVAQSATDNTTWTFSSNPALCILDYLRDDMYGLGSQDDEIDWTSFQTAANDCDVTIGSEVRYALNGVIDSSRTPSEILTEMAQACAGTVYYSNGKWHMRAGVYETPVGVLTADDFLSSIEIATRVSNQNNFNAVKGIFVSPADSWQPVDYPAITSATFEAEDGGYQKFADLPLPLTTSSTMAQRIAKIALYRAREQITVNVTCKMSAFQYNIGDTLYITYDRMGWDQKVFEVVGWNYAVQNGAPAINLSLKETSAAVYSWTLGEEEELTRNNVSIVTYYDVSPPTGLTVTQPDDGSGNYYNYLDVSWTAPTTGAPISRYEVQWTLSTAYSSLTTWQTSAALVGIAEGTYTVRIRSVNISGVRSDWVTTTIVANKPALFVGTDDIADGAVNIDKIANILQSTDYVEGVSGWEISKAGTAEFNDVTVRGTIKASTLDTDSLVIATDTDCYAPFSFATYVNYTGNTTSLTLNFDQIQSPDTGSGYHGFRMASHTTPIQVFVVLFGDLSTITLKLHASYDGGAYTEFASIARNLDYRSGHTLGFTYTPTQSTWDTLDIRLTSVGTRTEQLTGQLMVINGT